MVRQVVQRMLARVERQRLVLFLAQRHAADCAADGMAKGKHRVRV